MKYVVSVLMLMAVIGCAYESRISSKSNDGLCGELGEQTLYRDTKSINLVQDEIARRGIDKQYCESLANTSYQSAKKKFKQEVCEDLAANKYKGNYEKYKNNLDTIAENGFADTECQTIGEFYFIKLNRNREKNLAIAAALNQVGQDLQRLGTTTNPINIRIRDR